MLVHLRRAAALAAPGLLALGMGLGCGDSKPAVDTTKAPATVKGTVTFKGKPVTKGEVAFDPSNYQRKDEAARRAEIGPDGTYSVDTLAGGNRVSFRIAEMMRDPMLQDLSLQYDAQPGENTYNIELPPPAANP